MTNSTSDTDETRRRGSSRQVQAITASNLAVMLIGAVYLIQYWQAGAMPLFWALSGALLAAAANVFFLRRTGRTVVTGYIATCILFAVVLVSVANTGGFQDPAFAWLYLVPLAAGFLVDLRALWIFVTLVLGATVGFWLLDPGTFPDLIPREMHSFQNLWIRLGAVSAVGLMTTFFVRAQQMVRRKLAMSNRALESEADAHRRTMRALELSEVSYRDLVENSADLIWTHDLSGRVLSINDAAVKLLGYSRDEIVGSEVLRYLGHQTAEAWDKYVNALASRGVDRGYTVVFTRDGDRKVLEYNNTLRTDGVKQPIVRAVVRDVTEQSKARRALRRRVEQEQLMVAISTRFIHLDQSVLAGAIRMALAEIGQFLACDRVRFFVLEEGAGAFEEVYGWRSDGDELAGAIRNLPPPQALPWLFGRLELLETIVIDQLEECEPEGRPEVSALLDARAESAVVIPVSGRQGLVGVLTLESFTSERRWLRDDHSLGHLAGHVFGNAILRVRNEQQTLRLESEVQQARKMESLGLVAGGIAHDFNNLLMVILGNTAIALENAAEGSDATVLREIEESAQQAADLTAQMLAFSGKARFASKPASLNTIAGDEVSRAVENSEGRVRIELELDPEKPTVLGDETQLQQVVRNLVENGLEAIGERSGSVTVRTGSTTLSGARRSGVYRPLRRSLPAGSYGTLDVTDSGPGVEAAMLPKIFDPFFSTKFTGRGLGLAAVLGIVRGHKGSLEVESSRSGTTVRVLLPLDAEAVPVAPGVGSLISSPVAEIEGGGTNPRTEGDQNGHRILLMDPDPAILAALQGLLASTGRDTVRTSSPSHAAEVLVSDPTVSAVIADLAAAELDTNLRKLRWRHEEVPWILSCSEPRDEVADRLVALGASAFLPKPFPPDQLISLVDQVLREYGLASR